MEQGQIVYVRHYHLDSKREAQRVFQSHDHLSQKFCFGVDPEPTLIKESKNKEAEYLQP